LIKSWTDRKTYLCNLIKQVSDIHGGDDPKWLEEYTDDVVKDNLNDLQEAISCFRSLCAGHEKKLKNEASMAVKQYFCNVCKLRPPFCRFDLYEKCSNIDKV
jgi:hypothetical protein